MTYPAVSPKKRTARHTRPVDIFNPRSPCHDADESSSFRRCLAPKFASATNLGSPRSHRLRRRHRSPKQQARKRFPNYCRRCGGAETDAEHCGATAKKEGPPEGGPSKLSRRAWLFRGNLHHVRDGELSRGGGALALLVQDELVAPLRDLPERRHRAAGAGRDQPADDHVLLEPFKRVGLAVDRRIGQHARCLLEGRRGDERAGLQARLGDAEQHRDGL